MLGAALFAVIFRVNLPLAVFTTLYTNPFTIIPLYIFAFTIGQWLLGTGGQLHAPPEMEGISVSAWLQATQEWMLGLGSPLALGLVVLASGLALLGYLLAHAAWYAHLVYRLKKRHKRADKNST